jgi:hypothetical protein
MLDNDQLMDESFYRKIPKNLESFEGIDLSTYVCLFDKHINLDTTEIIWETITEKNYFPFQRAYVRIENLILKIYREHHKSSSPEFKEFGIKECDYFWIPKAHYRIFTGKKEVPSFPDFKKVRPDSIR